MDEIQHLDQQDAACDSQSVKDINQSYDPQGEACDSQPIVDHTGGQQCAVCDYQSQLDWDGRKTGAIPKKKIQRPSRVNIGRNANKELLDETIHLLGSTALKETCMKSRNPKRKVKKLFNQSYNEPKIKARDVRFDPS